MRYIYLVLTVAFNAIGIYLSSLSNALICIGFFVFASIAGLITYTESKSKPNKDKGVGILLGSATSLILFILILFLFLKGGVC
jgi:hypothetical protein